MRAANSGSKWSRSMRMRQMRIRRQGGQALLVAVLLMSVILLVGVNWISRKATDQSLF